MNPDQQPIQASDGTIPAEISPEEIALCAYAIWEREGRPEGCDVEHWQQAETQLRAIRKHG
jgi:hypothetical protein